MNKHSMQRISMNNWLNIAKEQYKKGHIGAALSMVDNILICDDTNLGALKFRSDVRINLGDADGALADIEASIKIYINHHKLDKQLRDYHLYSCYRKAGNIHLRLKKDAVLALGFYKKALPCKLKSVYDNLFFAELALHNQEYEFAAKAAYYAFLYYNIDRGKSSERFILLIEKLGKIVEQNSCIYPIAEAYLLGQRLFINLLLAGNLYERMFELFITAKKVIKKYPDRCAGYEYVGAAFYDAGSYIDALPYLKKAIQIGCASPCCFSMLFFAVYHIDRANVS